MSSYSVKNSILLFLFFNYIHFKAIYPTSHPLHFKILKTYNQFRMSYLTNCELMRLWQIQIETCEFHVPKVNAKI
jgi:hypothetical protein